MTATLGRRRQPRRTPRPPNPPRHSGKDYVECPVCRVPTGSFAPYGCHGFITTPYRNASGDGTRCHLHRRTESARAAETARVLRWIAQYPIESQLVHE